MAHIPVLLKEVIELLDPKPGQVVVDGTFGGGGYAEAIVKKLDSRGTLIAFDLDPQMLKGARERVQQMAPTGVILIFLNRNFSELPAVLREREMAKVSGVVLDLGFSSDQLEKSGRGFSFLRDEPLLMTYSDANEPVREWLPRLNQDDLARIIRELGGERLAGRIARAIKERERVARIETTGELARIVASAVPRGYEHGRIHPATRTFLAFRIYANRELEHLEKFLTAVPEWVAPLGRVVIVSFQSLEDGLVKRYFREFVKAGVGVLLTKKPITPDAAEVMQNPRARSAKLRAVQIS